MIVNSIGHAAQFSELSPGDCYFYARGQQATFAMAIREPAGNMLACIFSKEDASTGCPWIAQGFYPFSVLRLQNVEIRPDWTALHFDPPGIGELTSAGGKFYIIGIAGHDRGTANLSDGTLEQRPDNEPFATFSRWSAGIVVDGKWVSLLEFT
jgi:hypothetical protein